MKEKKQDLAKAYKRDSILSRVLMMISVTAGIIPIFIVMNIIRMLSTQSATLKGIVLSGVIVGICQITKALFYALSMWQAHDFAYTSLAKIRLDMIEHLKKLPLGFFHKRKVGDLTHIMNHDVDQIELYLAHGLPEITVAILIPSIIAISLLFMDWRLGLALISTVPLVLIYQVILNKLIAGLFTHYTKSTKRMSEDLLEYIATIPVVKAFSREERRTNRVLDGMHNYIKWVKKMVTTTAFPMVFSNMLMEGGLVVLAIIGSMLLRDGKIDAHTFVLAIILGGLFSTTLSKLPTFHHIGIIYKNSASRIQSIMDVKPMKKHPHHNHISGDDIVLKDVSFGYEKDQYILNHVDVVFKKNSVNAIVGTSGSGKTTLANLLMGFWQPQKGQISIHGQPIDTISEQDLSNLMSMVQQETYLFNMSIKDNIKIGNKDASDEHVIQVAKRAQIHHMIMDLPKGYDTLVGESGAKLSGGEKQRLSIARTMLKDTPIIILDEATSAIDASNEYLIQKALDHLSQHKTIITIAHHIHTIKKADQIIVMDNGSILAKGTHDHLMKSCSLYKKMVEEQSSVDNWQIKEVVNI
ncbi:ABC transporter ATP-binding protein [Vallitalea pronyensis]|nr:ABC transporter ATP-binding protein [Vallitalea pronyensis]